MTILEGIMPLIWWGISTLTLLLLITLILIGLLFRRMKRFEGAYVALQTFMTGKQLDRELQEYYNRVTEHQQELIKCSTRLTSLEKKVRASVDHLELIRFRAFENMGSDLSFALAFMNQEGDGVVVTSIHNREESRVYAKPVNAGQSTYSLTNEEKEVIVKAMQGPKI